MNNPILSVIIPCFNAENTIEKCIESILNQSFKDLEIIAIDDSSTDNTVSIINRLKKENEERIIKVIQPVEKLYACGARNLGMELAKGDYIGFIDNDDWLDSSFYSRLIDKAVESHADIAICGVLREYSSAKASTIRYHYKNDNVINGKFALKLLTNSVNQDIGISSICNNKIYSRSYMQRQNIQFICNRSNDDDHFTFVSLLSAKKVALVSGINYHYLQRHDSVAHTVTRRNFDDLIHSFAEIKKYLVKKDAYNEHQEDYYSFYEKCLTFLLEVLYQQEQDTTVRLEYIKYLLSASSELFSFSDYVEFLGPERIYSFLTR